MTYAETLDGGGVERAQLRLAAGWLAAGRRVTLVVGDRKGPLAAELPAGIEIVDLHSRRYLAMLALPRLVRRLRPDAIFCAGNYYTLIAAWTRWRLGRATPPILAKMSNAPDRGDHGLVFAAGHRAWLRLHGRFLDHLVAMTPATARVAARAMRMDGRTSVIANPPALPAAATAPPLPLPAGPFVLGVGRLVPQKRWDRLVAAVPKLPAGIPLVILGDGERRAALAAQAAALGVADRVMMPGHAADPLPAMASARVLALTSDYEGVPGVLREALSVGTPVVTTDSTTAVDEIVASPSQGTVVARDDADGLARALTHWLDAPRPVPTPQPGIDSAQRYLDVFDALVGG